jgi:hypothetical protein
VADAISGITQPAQPNASEAPTVAISQSQDSFVFAPTLGESTTVNLNAENDAFGPTHSGFADLMALITETHHDAAMHDGTGRSDQKRTSVGIYFSVA